MSGQLEIVARLARERQEEAARALAEAQGNLSSVRAQFDQIQAYQADYRAKARGDRDGALAANQLVEARRFLLEINAIVDSQQAQLEQAEAAVNQRRQLWADAARYTQAIEKLASERGRVAQRAEEKRQQQQLDDLFGQQRFNQR